MFNEEYEETAKKKCTGISTACQRSVDDRLFLRNEPSWAFVDNLVLADETLYNPARTSCKEKLIARMEEKYQSIDALNKAWNTDFVSFTDLYRPQKEISKRSDAAKEDMRAFSRDMAAALCGNSGPCLQSSRSKPYDPRYALGLDF